MENNLKRIVSFFIIFFAIYCALIIGLHWDATSILTQGNDKIKYLFSFGKINDPPFWYRYFPGVSYAVNSFLINLFPLNFKYEVFHILNLIISFFGALGVTKISKELFNSKASYVILLIIILHPIFFGHMAMNHKDMVVLTSMVWIVYYFLRYLKKQSSEEKRIKYLYKIGILLSVGTGIRIVFIATLAPIIIFLLFDIFYFKKLTQKNFSKKKFFIDSIKVFLVFYLILMLFWTDAHSNILKMPIEIFLQSVGFLSSEIAPTAIAAGILNGEIYWAADSPKKYVAINFLLKTPEYILVMYLFSAFFFIKGRVFFKKKFTNFYYKILFILFVLIFYNFLFAFSPYPLYDGMRLFLFIIPFFIIIPGLGIYYMISNNYLIHNKICIILIFPLFILFLVKFIYLTPYHYVYLNIFNEKTTGDNIKFENDYLGVSLKELIKNLDYINKKSTKLTLCGVSPPNVKYYLRKNNLTKVRTVTLNEKPDFILMTNRVAWDGEKDLGSIKTCFQKYPGKDLSYVKRGNLVLSTVRKF